MVTKEIINRKGARKLQEIPKEVLTLLNAGAISTVNLTEWLAIDQIVLIANIFPKIGLSESIESITKKLKQQKKPSSMSSIKLIGQLLYEHCRQSNTLTSSIQLLSSFPADTIRCYATYLIALNTDIDISKKLNQSKTLIADIHFGVREIVWMALRPEIEKNLAQSIDIMTKWVSHSDENIRRFCMESIRPRGVWCKHIDDLKMNPQKALPILESLKSDPSKYVQNSVGNWLNDSSKSNQKFVIELCKKWESESQTPETKKIITRALRTINKSLC